MEYHNRRNRRGKTRTRQAQLHATQQKQTFLNSFYSLLIMSSLIIIVYLMLDYHCNVCSKKCDLHNITRNIFDITHNITHMKHSYNDLEKTIEKFSSELPKIEGQIEVLEVLAKSMKRDYGWGPGRQLSISSVDIFLNKPKKIPVNSPGVANLTTKNHINIGKD